MDCTTCLCGNRSVDWGFHAVHLSLSLESVAGITLALQYLCRRLLLYPSGAVNITHFVRWKIAVALNIWVFSNVDIMFTENYSKMQNLEHLNVITILILLVNTPLLWKLILISATLFIYWVIMLLGVFESSMRKYDEPFISPVLSELSKFKILHF